MEHRQEVKKKKKNGCQKWRKEMRNGRKEERMEGRNRRKAGRKEGRNGRKESSHAMGETSAGCTKYSVLTVNGFEIRETPSIFFHLK